MQKKNVRYPDKLLAENSFNTEPDDKFIQALTEGSLYDHPTDEIKIIETHISWVFLTGPYAYKIKKPVNLGFADFSTLSRRHFFCQEEIRLNSRLAPTLYIGVVAFYGTRENPSFFDRGSPIEYAVKMVQFPQDQLLNYLIEKEGLQASHIDDLAKKVSAFHESIDVADKESPFGTPELINEQAQENFDHLFDVIDNPTPQEQELKKWFSKEFSAHFHDFASRKSGGFIRECHGDMHLGNMLLQDGEVIIFDGIDFNEDLRWVDVGSEVAFLTMDLEDRGRPDLAHYFINSYLEITGDYDLLKTLPFYLCYRAMVRAKVAGIRLKQSRFTSEERQRLKKVLSSYLDLAKKYSGSAEPRLFITHGVSGSGKTYGTQKLVEASAAIRIRSDVERKRIFGLSALEKSSDYSELDLYTPDVTARTYNHLAQQVGLIIRAGFTVIVDATFTKHDQRKTFQNLAKELDVPFTILHFYAQEETLRRRVTKRCQKNNDASEADLAVLHKQLETLENLTREECSDTVEINTETPEAVQKAMEII